MSEQGSDLGHSPRTRYSYLEKSKNVLQKKYQKYNSIDNNNNSLISQNASGN